MLQRFEFRGFITVTHYTHAKLYTHTHTYFIALSLLHSNNLLHRIDRIDYLAIKNSGCDRIHLF